MSAVSDEDVTPLWWCKTHGRMDGECGVMGLHDVIPLPQGSPGVNETAPNVTPEANDCPECGGWGRLVLAVDERHKPVGWGALCPRGCPPADVVFGRTEQS